LTTTDHSGHIYEVGSFTHIHNSVFSRTIRPIFLRHNSSMAFGGNTKNRKVVRLLQQKQEPFSSDKTRRSGLFPDFSRYPSVPKTTLYQPFSIFCKPYPTKIWLGLLSTTYSIFEITAWRGTAQEGLDKPLDLACEDEEDGEGTAVTFAPSPCEQGSNEDWGLGC
jgi:hypothetical protein